ncbi:hypothetical protein EJB05_57755, partial [Eragrostis curvula]
IVKSDMASVEGCIAQFTIGSTEPWAFGWEPWTPPTLKDLLPELSLEEQLRLKAHLREHERILKRMNKISPPLPSLHSEEYVLGQIWYHANFWARNCKSNKIKRFFAEVHYKPPTCSSVCSSEDTPEVDGTSSSSVTQFPAPIPIVEACTIVGKSHLTSTGGAAHSVLATWKFLHPVGSRKFVETTRIVSNNSNHARNVAGLGWHSLARPGTVSANRPEEETKKF